MRIKFWLGIGFGALTVGRNGSMSGLYLILPFIRIHILELDKQLSTIIALRKAIGLL